MYVCIHYQLRDDANKIFQSLVEVKLAMLKINTENANESKSF